MNTKLDSEGHTLIEWKIVISDLPLLAHCPSLLLLRRAEVWGVSKERRSTFSEPFTRELADNLRRGLLGE